MKARQWFFTLHGVSSIQVHMSMCYCTDGSVITTNTNHLAITDLAYQGTLIHLWLITQCLKSEPCSCHNSVLSYRSPLPTSESSSHVLHWVLQPCTVTAQTVSVVPALDIHVTVWLMRESCISTFYVHRHKQCVKIRNGEPSMVFLPFHVFIYLLSLSIASLSYQGSGQITKCINVNIRCMTFSE